MKKLLLLLFSALLIASCAGMQKQTDIDKQRQLEQDIRDATRSAGKWSSYGDMGDGVIADDDTLMIKDKSDTGLGSGGTQKQYQWADVLLDLQNFSELEFPNANDTTTLVDGQAEVAHDNNNPGIVVHDNVNPRYYATRTKCLPTIILAEPDELQPIADVWTLVHFPAEQYPAGFVIEAIHISTSATCTDVLVFEEWSNSGTAWSHQNDVESITLSGTHTEDDGSLAHDTINADYYLRLDLPASPTNIASYEITVCGQIPVYN